MLRRLISCIVDDQKRRRVYFPTKNLWRGSCYRLEVGWRYWRCSL